MKLLPIFLLFFITANSQTFVSQIKFDCCGLATGIKDTTWGKVGNDSIYKRVNGEIVATGFKKIKVYYPYDSARDNIYNQIANRSLLSHNHTGVYQPVGSYLVAADIAGKQNNITLTTTGSGAATFVGATLNIPTPAGGGSSPIPLKLVSNFSNSTVTQTPVTGWTVPVVAGKTYRIVINASYQTAATTTGGTLGFYMTSGSGTITGEAKGHITQAAAATPLSKTIWVCTTLGAAGSFLTTTAVAPINAPHYFGADVFFTCTVSGNLQIGWASEVAGSASQLNANSSLIYQALN